MKYVKFIIEYHRIGSRASIKDTADSVDSAVDCGDCWEIGSRAKTTGVMGAASGRQLAYSA